MLPLPFHHALQHHGCSVPFVHHHPHCKLFTFDFWSRKRVTVRLGWRNVAMSNIYIYIYRTSTFCGLHSESIKIYFCNLFQSTVFLATPPIV
jgi:hypothetical protein